MSKLGNSKLGSFAVLTILSRDIFGYLFAGFAFVLAIESQFGLVTTLTIPLADGGGFQDVVYFILITGLSYPVGHMLSSIGHKSLNLFDKYSYKEAYKKCFSDLDIDYLQLQSPIVSKGCTVTAENIDSTLGRMPARQVFMKRPDVYFLWEQRSNTVRVLRQTLLGLVLGIGVIVLFTGILRSIHDGNVDWFVSDMLQWSVLVVAYSTVLYLTFSAAAESRIHFVYDRVLNSLTILNSSEEEVDVTMNRLPKDLNFLQKLKLLLPS